jgi:hypothetical protein
MENNSVPAQAGPVHPEEPPVKEFELRLAGMTCGSCEKLIERIAADEGASIMHINAKDGVATLLCREDRLDALKGRLAQKGFPEREADGARGSPEGVKRYLLSLLAGEPHVEVESNLMKYAAGSLVVLLAVGAFGYGYLLKAFGSPVAAVSLFLLVVGGSVMVVFSYFHMACYRKNMSCSNGMMVGMTTGMIAGYITGALVAATNGMFVGSVVGLAFGVGIGLALGRHCGIMGALEGIMAGLMSGIMGAMTSIMLINDNLLAMLYILGGISITTLGGLSYMMHREAGPAPMAELGARFDNFFMASVLLSALLLLTMIYGPKGPITLIR